MFGLVSEISLKTFGNLKNFTQGPSDNDGLWNMGENSQKMRTKINYTN